MTLLRERVNFQVSRKRSFARAPNPPSTFAKFPIKVATMCPHGNRERVLFDTNRSEMSRGRRKVSGPEIAQDQGPGGFPGWGFTFRYWRLPAPDDSHEAAPIAHDVRVDRPGLEVISKLGY